MTARSYLSVACLSAFVLMGAFPRSASAVVRKCVAEDGEILFTDQSCPPGSRLDREIERPAPSEPEPPPPAAHPRPEPEAVQHPRTPAAVAPPVPMIAKAVLAARFSRALADLSTLKIYSMSHMAESGDWPLEPGQMGLDASTFDTDDIVEIGYRKDGGIVAYLAPAFGHGKWLWMNPRAALGRANVSWQCRTNVEKQALLPGVYGTCEWQAPAERASSP